MLDVTWCSRQFHSQCFGFFCIDCMWDCETLIPSSSCWFSLVWPFAGRIQAPYMTFNPIKLPTTEQLITPKHRDVKYRRQACLMGQWKHIKSLRCCIHFTWWMETEDGPGIDIHFRCSKCWNADAKYRFKQGANCLARTEQKAQSYEWISHHICKCVMFLSSVVLITEL